MKYYASALDILRRYRVIFTILVVLVAIVSSSFIDSMSAQAAAAKVRWKPPKLSNPQTITLGTGRTVTTLDDKKDYIVKLPKSKKTGSTSIIGGRNVVIMGGHITIPPTHPTNNTDMDRRAIYIKDNKGTVHIEGVLIDGSGGGEMDGVAINAPQSIVQIQNLRVTGVKGTDGTMHADVVQTWGGVKELRIDRLTGESYYQGLFIAIDQNTIGKALISNTNLRALGDQPWGGGGGGYMITLTKRTCNAYRVEFYKVYVEPRKQRPFNKSVWPDVNTPETLACAVRTWDGYAYWPNLPASGRVYEGLPPGGDFVKAGSVGVNYTSPGYW